MRLRHFLALAGLILLAAGCGNGSTTSTATTVASNGEAEKTALQIIADAEAAALLATSVHVSGSGLSDGKPLALDLRLVAGKGGAGRITAGGLKFDIVRIGRKAYFKGDAAFWSHFGGPAAAQLFKGRWLQAPSTTGDLASFTPLTDIAKLTKGILDSHGTLKKGATTTIHGQPAIAVIDTEKGGTLYVAATGTPYPLKLTSGKGSSGAVSFAEWNQPVALTRPKNAIDYSKLKRG